MLDLEWLRRLSGWMDGVQIYKVVPHHCEILLNRQNTNLLQVCGVCLRPMINDYLQIVPEHTGALAMMA